MSEQNGCDRQVKSLLSIRSEKFVSLTYFFVTLSWRQLSCPMEMVSSARVENNQAIDDRRSMQFNAMASSSKMAYTASTVGCSDAIFSVGPSNQKHMTHQSQIEQQVRTFPVCYSHSLIFALIFLQ